MSEVVHSLDRAREIIEEFLNAPTPTRGFILIDRDDCWVKLGTPVTAIELDDELTYKFQTWLSGRMGAYTREFFESLISKRKVSRDYALGWVRERADDEAYSAFKKWLEGKDANELWMYVSKVVMFVGNYMGMSDGVEFTLERCYQG